MLNWTNPRQMNRKTVIFISVFTREIHSLVISTPFCNWRWCCCFLPLLLLLLMMKTTMKVMTKMMMLSWCCTVYSNNEWWSPQHVFHHALQDSLVRARHNSCDADNRCRSCGHRSLPSCLSAQVSKLSWAVVYVAPLYIIVHDAHGLY